MAQISITLAPTLSVAMMLAPTLGIALTLTGGGATVTVVSNGSPLTLAQSAPLVVAALYEFLRGPPGADAPPVDLVADPLAYYILAKA